MNTRRALRNLAGHLVEVSPLSPTTEFIYRPVTIAEAFDRAEARVYDLVEIHPSALCMMPVWLFRSDQVRLGRSNSRSRRGRRPMFPCSCA